MKIALVVAIAENGVIGSKGGLPWRLSTDLKRFKATTMGKPILMGRKTWESIGRPLPGRRNIVITRDGNYKAEGAEVVGSLDEALELARNQAEGSAQPDEISIIGGGQVYREIMPLADRLYVTHVLANVDGDTYFPEIDPGIWQPVRSEEVPAGEKDIYPTRHVVYERRQGK